MQPPVTLFDPADVPVRALAADRWPTNGHLIENVAGLGMLRAEWLTLDATHGDGTWWTRWRPDRLVTNDIGKSADVRADYHRLPFAAATFDAVCFDPPYVLKGGRTTSGIPTMDDHFGMNTTPKGIGELQAQNHGGLTECVRVTKPGGTILIKYQNQVSSGHTWAGAHLIYEHALTLGVELAQEFIHVHGPGPQPRNRRQVHAANNYSVLLVLRRAATRT